MHDPEVSLYFSTLYPKMKDESLSVAYRVSEVWSQFSSLILLLIQSYCLFLLALRSVSWLTLVLYR